MANGSYSVTNLAAASTSVVTVSGSLDSTNYPVSLLYDGKASVVHRFSTKTAVWMKVDLGSAQTAKVVALFNHNLTNGATITLEGNATDAWGAPSYTHAITWRAQDCFLLLDASYRWWRLTIEDAGNPRYPYIGEWFVGSYISFTWNFDFPARGVDEINMSSTGVAGQIAAINYATLRRYQIKWTNWNATIKAEVQAFHTAIKGSVTAFAFIPDTAGTDIYYMRCGTDVYTWQELTADTDAGASFDLVEMPRGLAL